MIHSLSIRWVSIFAAGVLLFAQEPPTFKTNTNLVIVNVAVRDKSGKPVDTLKKEDFTLLEDGQPQAISVFEVEHLSATPDTPIPPVQRLKARPSEPQTPAAAASPSQPAAEPARPTLKDRRLLALFFDFSSMQPPEQIRSKDAAIKFLREQMTQSDLVSIMTFGSQLNVLEDFTDDRERLISDIEKLRPGDSSELAGLASTGADATDDSGEFTADDTEFNIFNTDRKLAGLETAARKLSAYPEKKAVIYFSSGIPKTGLENQSQLRATVNAAVRANVSFYPIDARGLIATPPAGDASTASPKGTGVFTASTQTGIRNQIIDQQETISTLASDTGGKALLDNNDLALGITAAQKDISSYYILGYYSTNTAVDGKYRKLKVKLNGELQAKLEYRNGYYAQKRFQKFSASDKEQQLEQALALGDPVTDLPLAVEIDYFRMGRDRYFVPISAKIPGSLIGLSKRDRTDFDFIGQVHDARGKLVTAVRDGITVKLKQAQADEIAHRQFEYDTGVVLEPGEYRLTFLARENQTGKMGTFETNFTVPDLDKQSKGVHLSSVVWSNEREPLASSVGSAGNNNKKLERMHPLVRDGQKLVPSITRVFRKNQQMYVYFEVYNPGTESEQKTATSIAAELTLFRGTAKEFESQPVRLVRTAANRQNTVAVQFQIPLSSLAPGDYTAQVNIVDELARKFGFVRAPVVIQ